MEIYEASHALAAISHESRLEIFRLLVRSAPEGLAVGEIGQALDIPGATLNFHLNHLKQAGVVAEEKLGRSRICRANLAQIQALMSYLLEDCCQGKLCC